MINLLFPFILCLISCQTHFVPNIYDDPTFFEYKLSYQIETGRDVSHIPIHFDNNLGTLNGICRTRTINGVTRRFILIAPKKYHDWNYFQREEILFHEFGHCDLRLSHDNRTVTLDNGNIIPYSIMYETGPIKNAEDYLERRQDYMNQFRDHINKGAPYESKR